TGAPVAKATVRLEGKGFRAGMTTANDGMFHFGALPISRGTVTVERSGFSPIRAEWNAEKQGSVPLEITLQLKSTSERVTVTATRTDQRARRSAASVPVRDQPALSTSGGVTLDDALGQVPGFNLFRRNGSLSANPTALGVSLRGVGSSGASRALVISDG